jgi:ketosteroid isomerase-like protein
MSQENVEVVRRIYEAFAAHRFPAEHLSEDFSWETHSEQPGADTHRGHEAVRDYWREWVGGWRDAKSEVERVIDCDDQVIVLVHGRYRLSETGVPVEEHYGHIWTVRGAKAVHARAVTRGEALKAVGLEE